MACLSWKWRKRSSVKITERTYEEATEALHAGREGRHSEEAFGGRSADLGSGPDSEIGGGKGTAEQSPPAGRVTDETDYFQLADHSEIDTIFVNTGVFMDIHDVLVRKSAGVRESFISAANPCPTESRGSEDPRATARWRELTSSEKIGT